MSVSVCVCVCVCLCVRVSTLSNMYISMARGPIMIKIYVNDHWAGGKAASGFGLKRIRTLDFMATDSSHRVIMRKMVLPLFLGCF